MKQIISLFEFYSQCLFAMFTTKNELKEKKNKSTIGNNYPFIIE